MPQSPLSFDPQHVATFLAKIDRDRQAKEAQIAHERDLSVARILADAHAESRRVFRRNAAEARARRESQTARVLARVRSDLLRERWNILVATQQRALEAIWREFLAAWQDPQQQLHWCRYWLREGVRRAAGEPMRVRCGPDILPATMELLRSELASQDGDAIHVDEHTEPGILVEWGDYILDGRLRSLCPAMAQAVLARVARVLAENGAIGGSDGAR